MPRDFIPLLFYVLSPVPGPRATFVGLRFTHVSYHVHVFVGAPQKLSVTFLVKYLKGTSAFRLFQIFP